MIRSTIDRFTRAMESKLLFHSWKGDWHSCTPDYLLDRLREEVEELEQAVSGDSSKEVLYEAADVANLAMMVADVSGGLDDMGSCISYLTEEEKRYLVKGLEREIGEGAVDEELIEGLRMINDLPGICTTQSCAGHDDGRDGYISLRMTEPLLRRFEARLSDLLRQSWSLWSEMNYELYGSYVRPRMVIWFKAGHWNEMLCYLLDLLLSIQNN